MVAPLCGACLLVFVATVVGHLGLLVVAVVSRDKVSTNKKIPTSAQIYLRLLPCRHLHLAAKISASPTRTHRRPSSPHLWTKQPLQGLIYQISSSTTSSSGLMISSPLDLDRELLQSPGTTFKSSFGRPVWTSNTPSICLQPMPNTIFHLVVRTPGVSTAVRRRARHSLPLCCCCYLLLV
jgi:hypothetical protein